MLYPWVGLLARCVISVVLKTYVIFGSFAHDDVIVNSVCSAVSMSNYRQDDCEHERKEELQKDKSIVSHPCFASESISHRLRTFQPDHPGGNKATFSFC